jgi:type VII secretion protein EssA
MKKIYSLLLLCLLFFSLPIQAEDTGNLKIDTDLQTPKEDRDISYLEQESAFSKLFNSKTTEKINKLKTENLEKGNEERQQIFTSDIEEIDTVKAYQDLLFRPNLSLPTNRERRVTLREEKKIVTWQMIAMICCAILVMGWSIFNFVRRNQKNNG